MIKYDEYSKRDQHTYQNPRSIARSQEQQASRKVDKKDDNTERRFCSNCNKQTPHVKRSGKCVWCEVGMNDLLD